MDATGNITTKDKEKAEVLNAFIASIIVNRVLSSLSLKTGMGSRINTLQFRRNS